MENAGILLPMRCSRGASLSYRRGFWEHAVPSSAERERGRKKKKKCPYFGLLSPGVPRLLMLQHERYSRSEGISRCWIYYLYIFFFNFFDTFALLDSARWTNTENESRRGLPHMCGTMQRSQAISGALWDIWPADPQNNSFGTALSHPPMPFISVLIHFFFIFMNWSHMCTILIWCDNIWSIYTF